MGNEIHALIVAAGSSSRMKSPQSKIFMKLNGKSLLYRSVSAFFGYGVKSITVVLRESDIPRAKEELKNFPVSYAIGGSERINSVAAGVDAIFEKDGIIAIHDGARPLVTAEIIKNAVEAVTENTGAVPSVPIKDTVKVIDAEGFCISTPERSSLRAVQTPQCFYLKEYRLALQGALESGINFTDDGGVFEYAENRVRLTEGSYENIKITTPEDMAVAKEILKRREQKC